MADKTDIAGSMLKALLPVMIMLMGIPLIQSIIPQPQYVCPICGEKFMTYNELYQHFITAHPSEPITITWE